MSALYVGGAAATKVQRGSTLVWEPAVGGGLDYLFASGQRGAYWDVSDLTTLYQDSTALTPVTAAGDPVGYVADKSGNGFHLLQATSAARPVYRTDGTLHWLEMDGVDDHLKTADTPVPAGFACIAARINTVSGSIPFFTTLLSSTLDSGNLRLWFYTNGGTHPGQIWRDWNSTVGPDSTTHRVNGVATSAITADAPSVNTADATGAALPHQIPNGAQIGKDRSYSRGYINGKFFGGLLHQDILGATDRDNVEAEMAALSGAVI